MPRRLWTPALLLWFSALLFAQDPEIVLQKKAYECSALEFKMQLPQGWDVAHDNVTMAARGKEAGVRVTREPFLYDPKEFGAKWQEQLAAAKIETKVSKARAGRYAAYSAHWSVDAERRFVYAIRAYVPQTEMLYNIAFSLPGSGKPPKWVAKMLRSFLCTAPKPKAELNGRQVTLGHLNMTLTLPEGYHKPPLNPRGPMRLGGGGSLARFVKLKKGYDKPREVGSLEVYAYAGFQRVQLPSGEQVLGNKVEEITDGLWARFTSRFKGRASKPKRKAASMGKHKGRLVVAELEQEGGERKVFYAFGTKHRNATIVLTLIVDARDAKLHKDLMKDVCKSLAPRG